MRKIAALCLAIAGLCSLAWSLPRPAAAAWPADPLVNVPLCTATGDQYWPVTVSDGAGGAIALWTDLRTGANFSFSDIYAQRVSAAGVAQWNADGVPVCTATGDQASVTAIPDGAGGAIVAWADFRSGINYEIYVQRISATGIPLWTSGGVPVRVGAGEESSPTLVSDGAGGAIVTWFGIGSINGYDIFAQRISAAGTPLWAANGITLCTAAGHQEYPTIVSDGAGGAIVTWFDQRTGTSYVSSDIYAQRVSAAGVPQWTADGVALCTAAGADQFPTITSDGAGGAIVAWYDYRSGTNYDIYAQRVSAGGVPQWTADGVALCTAANEQAAQMIVTDGVGGAIVSWRDFRNGFVYGAYAQRISAAGVPQWTANGVSLATIVGDQLDPNLVPDGAGGAVVTWPDWRSGIGGDVYAQRISGAGLRLWSADGVAVCTAAGSQNIPTLVSDGLGGAIISWYDRRGATYDIYAQRVKASGLLGGDVLGVPGEAATLAFALDPVRPNPARGGAMTVRFTLAGEAPASLELLDVAGRRVVARNVGSLGAGTHSLSLGGDLRLAPGVYMVCLRQGSSLRTTRVAVVE
jgi:hypothetical protein